MIRFFPAILLFLIACGDADSVTLIGSTQECTFRTELADTPEKRRLGLMHRTDLKPDAGMLFTWPRDVNNPFWMKNTPLPLDMFFIDSDLKIVCIQPQTTPFSTELLQCPSYYRWVLETNAGAAEKCGIKVGDRVKI